MMLASSSSREKFVDLDVHAWQWGALLAVIVAMLAIDLVRHREAHAPTTREALKESLVWVACGLSFGVVVLVGFGGEAFGEYLSGYLIEKSLSVDNVFVWSLLFTTMAIPIKFQHRVLFWGIFGALALRAAFIFAGTALISRFTWALVVFGLFLVFTGLKIIRHTENEGESVKTTGLGLLKKIMPVSEELDGQKFFTRVNARRAATPLFAALVVVEFTDLIFAVDSVPAILAVSNESYLVFASNAFAILGLRAMYFLLADAKERFHYLSHALGVILLFVGVKMTISNWVHLPTWSSLVVIAVVLTTAIVFSQRRVPSGGHEHLGDAESDDAHAH